jgi:hypothetical protein
LRTNNGGRILPELRLERFGHRLDLFVEKRVESPFLIPAQWSICLRKHVFEGDQTIRSFGVPTAATARIAAAAKQSATVATEKAAVTAAAKVAAAILGEDGRRQQNKGKNAGKSFHETKAPRS